MRIATEAVPLALVLLLAVLAATFFLHPWVGALLLAPLLFTLWFYRDPERSIPAEHGVLVSPADGKVIRARPGAISIFMNVFDVHVCRTPMGGEVQSVDHVSGSFLAAYKDSASDHNERTAIVVDDGARRIGFTLVAGLIARRIVCKVRPGERLETGQRVGLIQFGSRVDLSLPEDGVIAVTTGQRVVAGRTILARLPAVAPEVSS